MNKRIGLKKMGILLMVFLMTLVLFGCSNKKENYEEKENHEKVQLQNDKNEEPKDKTGVFIGDKAYDFTLLDREGNEIKLSDLKGKVVFLNFWTIWCGTCSKEMPYIQEIYEQYKDKDVVIAAVNVLGAEKVDMEGVNKFLDEKGYTFPVLYDVDGEVSVQYKVRAFPTTYIINKEGYIADFITEAMDKEMMTEKIENAMNQ
ncbi:redoxin domain-containing protein [Crassaminicella thermophila]|uniref:Redoxin domain-containing protein n=1 Tax=Crassaminicella thermophila TaxID=2599308 RepID=A0A5C0SIW9_CRATE|nr:redoxin domain-containing protein [Crassaminicella thermophila]QEK13394.1 redoxin domain-containing protein [Crassaminicella thermophila]